MAITKQDLQFLQSSKFKDLPESIYGAAMMAIIRSTQSYNSTVHGVTICVSAGLAFNILMQFYVLWCTKLYICVPAVTRVQALYAHFQDKVFVDGVFSEEAWEEFEWASKLCQISLSEPFFLVAVLVCWTATCWIDLLESFRCMSLWCHLESPTSLKERMLQSEDSEEEEEEHEEMTRVEETDEYVVLTAADTRTKMAAIGMIFLPKVAIAVYLWWLGTRWLVATTSFQDLLLNAVALAFITELDELIYHAVVPEDIQVLVRSYKVARPQTSEEADGASAEISHEWITRLRDRRLMYRIAAMVVTMVVIIGLPIISIIYVQDVLPGYNWDVHAPCESRLDLLMTAL